ncbi:MAG: ATP-binding protein [Clostridia bacterium]|nr:ATP-binding protein [Clostridia bacterium]
MELKNLGKGLENLVIFQNFKRCLLIQNLSGLLCAKDEEEAARFASGVAAEIYPKGANLTHAVLNLVLKDDNFFIRKRASSKEIEPEIEKCLLHELDILSQASSLNSFEVRNALGVEYHFPEWKAEKLDFRMLYFDQLANISKEGYGIFAKYRAFSILKDGVLSPIAHPDPLLLSGLYGYEKEREKVIKNTEALLNGLPTNNILLYGDAGTGKSSTVKAVANAYFEKGLRLIQIEKSLLHTIPALLDDLAENPLKFILFIDDLSFVSNDRDFTALKTVLEGSIAARSDNVVVYATSNRRHLVNETFGSRKGDEVHLNDTLEEVSSLSARFGIVITFGKPDRDLYITLVVQLAEHYGLSVSKQELIRGAEAYAIRSGGRSPRVARQYVEYKIAMG